MRVRIVFPLLSLLLAPSVAYAGDEGDEDEGDFADGPTAVAALEKKNETELAGWSSVQPATPYVYPRAKLVVDAPWGPFFDAFEKGSGALIAATLIPHPGVTMIGTPQPTLAWPWSFPLGPKLAATRAKRSFDVWVHRPFRILFEPAIVFGDEFIFSLRPGLRFMHHPSHWPVGIGAGLGSTIQLASKEGVRPSISPEAVVRLGRCCESKYVTLAARPDIFLSGKNAFLFSMHVGFTYF